MNHQQLQVLCKNCVPEQWSFTDVSSWLEQISLSEYKKIFQDSKIDGTMLNLLTEEDIKLGLNIQNFMHRKRIIKAIQVLQNFSKDKKIINNKLKPNVMANPFLKKDGKDSKMDIEFMSESLTNTNMEYEFTGSKSSLQVSKQLFNQGTTQNPFINNHGHQQTGKNIFQQSKLLVQNQSIKIGENGENVENKFENKFDLKNKENNNPESSQNDLSLMIENIIIPQKNEPEQIDQDQQEDTEDDQGIQEQLDDTQMEEESNQISNENPQSPQDQQISNQQELILSPIEGSYKYIFCVVDSDTTIGRHSSNQLVICDESVSRYHCKIQSLKGSFYLLDIGSTTGTYLKINKKFILKKGMTIEMGSNQFQVEKIEIKNNQEGVLYFKITEGEEEYLNKKYQINNKGSIGRKVDSAICFEDDVHLSNLHAVFSIENGKFIFEDMSSTNGSWLRLSNEQIESQPFLISHKDEIKIGLQCTFKAKIKQKESDIQYKQIVDTPSEKLFENNRCDICYEKEKNALLMPCKHNCTCILCAKNLTQCPICRGQITDFIKIYKS